MDPCLKNKMPGISGEDSFTPNQIENPKTQQAECKRP